MGSIPIYSWEAEVSPAIFARRLRRKTLTDLCEPEETSLSAHDSSWGTLFCRNDPASFIGMKRPTSPIVTEARHSVGLFKDMPRSISARGLRQPPMVNPRSSAAA